jgi:hypothetical protein
MTPPRLRASARRFASALLLCCASALSLSCASDPSQGYSFSSTYPKGIRTVTIPIFDNYTFTPGLEVQLTEAIIKELQRSSGVRVSTAEQSDSRLHGVITGVQLRKLSLEHTTGMVQEQAVQLTVNFEWRDNRTGKTLVSRQNFSASDTFVPARPVGERVEVGQEATIQRLARDIVSEMRSAW